VSKVPLRVGEEAPQYRGIQIAIAFEIAIEPDVRQARTGHDLVERDTLKIMPIEQPACAVLVLQIAHSRHDRSRGDGHWAVRLLVDRYRRRLYRPDEAHTGADRPFVIACAAFTISLLTVLVAISRLRGRARIADDRSGEQGCQVVDT